MMGGGLGFIESGVAGGKLLLRCAGRFVEGTLLHRIAKTGRLCRVLQAMPVQTRYWQIVGNTKHKEFKLLELVGALHLHLPLPLHLPLLLPSPSPSALSRADINIGTVLVLILVWIWGSGSVLDTLLTPYSKLCRASGRVNTPPEEEACSASPSCTSPHLPASAS